MPKSTSKKKNTGGNDSQIVINEISDYLSDCETEAAKEERRQLEALEAEAEKIPDELTQAVLNIPGADYPPPAISPLSPKLEDAASILMHPNAVGTLPQNATDNTKLLSKEAEKSLKLLRSHKPTPASGSTKQKPLSMPVLVGTQAQPSVTQATKVWPPSSFKPNSSKTAVDPTISNRTGGKNPPNQTIGKNSVSNTVTVKRNPVSNQAVGIQPMTNKTIGKTSGINQAANGRAPATSQQQAGSSRATNEYGEVRTDGWFLANACPTWSERLVGLSEHLKDMKDSPRKDVVLSLPMAQFTILHSSLAASYEILDCAYQLNKEQIKPYQIGSFKEVWRARGVAKQEAALKFVPSREMGVQTVEQDYNDSVNGGETVSSPQLVIDEAPAPEPPYVNPEDIPGPSTFNPMEVVGATHNRDPRRVPFQTWHSKTSFPKRRGASHGSRGRVEPYKPRPRPPAPSHSHVQPPQQPRGQPVPRPRPPQRVHPAPRTEPLPVGYYASAKDARRTPEERRLVELLKQTQNRLKMYHNERRH